jgi:hypothetical protein
LSSSASNIPVTLPRRIVGVELDVSDRKFLRKNQKKYLTAESAEIIIAAMQIEKNIPMPSRGGSRSPWPWSELGLGDSFLVENRSIIRVSSMACKARERTGFRFSCRTEGENVRVWRIA